MSKEMMEAASHDLNLLAGYLEGGLTDRERAALVAHLVECRECRETLAAYSRAAGSQAPGPAAWWRIARDAWLPLAAMLVVATAAGITVVRITDQSTTRHSTDGTPPSVSDVPLASQPSGEAPPAATVPEQPAAAPAEPSGPSRIDQEVTRLRGAERRIAGKRFRLISGEWLDRDYDPFGDLPVIEVRTAGERAKLLQRVPALRPYAAFGSRVTVVHEGTIYKFGGSE